MSNVALKESQNPKAARFTESIIRVLRPLIRLMVGNITFQAFIGLAKQIYVEEAQRELKKEDPQARVTKSALALITGIDTRAISQLLNAKADDNQHDAQYLQLEAAVLADWGLKPEYRGAENQPVDLPVYGRGMTFQSLVTKTAGRNVTAQTVLDRLISSGNVELIDENTVRLISRIYFPLTGAKYETIDNGMHAASNLLRTVQHNLDNKDRPDKRLVQQQRWSMSIPREKYSAFKAVMTQMMRSQIDDTFKVIEDYEDEEDKNADNVTAGVGFYYFESLEDND